MFLFLHPLRARIGNSVPHHPTGLGMTGVGTGTITAESNIPVSIVTTKLAAIGRYSLHGYLEISNFWHLSVMTGLIVTHLWPWKNKTLE